ncbi:hypothetical protein RB195_005016 [Necator americanus]
MRRPRKPRSGFLMIDNVRTLATSTTEPKTDSDVKNKAPRHVNEEKQEYLAMKEDSNENIGMQEPEIARRPIDRQEKYWHELNEKEGDKWKIIEPVHEGNGISYNIFMHFDFNKDLEKSKIFLKEMLGNILKRRDQEDGSSAGGSGDDSDPDVELTDEDRRTLRHPCSTHHERLVKRFERAGCTGVSDFSSTVCRDFFECVLKTDASISRCDPKICENFNVIRKKKKCYVKLFPC